MFQILRNIETIALDSLFANCDKWKQTSVNHSTVWRIYYDLQPIPTIQCCNLNSLDFQTKFPSNQKENKLQTFSYDKHFSFSCSESGCFYHLFCLTCELCGRQSNRKGKATGVCFSCISNWIWAQRKLVKMTTNDKTGSNLFTFVHWIEHNVESHIFFLRFCTHWCIYTFIFPLRISFFYVCFCSTEETAARFSMCGIFLLCDATGGGHWFSGTFENRHICFGI